MSRILHLDQSISFAHDNRLHLDGPLLAQCRARGSTTGEDAIGPSIFPTFSRIPIIVVLLVEKQENSMRIEQKLAPESGWYGLVARLRAVRSGQCGVLTLPNSRCDLLGFRRFQGRISFSLAESVISLPGHKESPFGLSITQGSRIHSGSTESDRCFIVNCEATHSSSPSDFPKERSAIFLKGTSKTHADRRVCGTFFWTTSNGPERKTNHRLSNSK